MQHLGPSAKSIFGDALFAVGKTLPMSFDLVQTPLGSARNPDRARFGWCRMRAIRVVIRSEVLAKYVVLLPLHIRVVR